MIKLRFTAFSSLIPIFLLVLITFIAYINILPNKLFFDDEELIYKNTYIRDLKLIPKYFTSNMIEGAGKISNMYRPILTLSLAFDYFIWKDNPFGYHLTSILLHTVNTVLVFILFLRLFGNKLISFFTACLFSIHPGISEAVIYASGRTDPLYTFFGLLTLIIFLSLITSDKFHLAKFIISIITFILALLSKESAIIIPLLFILIGIISRFGKYLTGKKSIYIISPFIIISILYFYLRLTVLNFSNTLNFYSTGINNPDITSYSQNLIIRFFTFTKAFFIYLYLLIFPKDLIIARDLSIIKLFFNLWVFLFLFIFIFIIVFSIKFYKKDKIFIFAFLWFFITILPVSGIIPINNIIAEHYLYLPSLSFFLIISYLINLIYVKYKSIEIRTSIFIFLSTIIILLMIRTIIRTFDWRNPITFYIKSLTQSPYHVPMRHNLAMSYAEDGQFDLAVKEYQNVITIADIYPNTHHNLADVYKAQGKYKEAEREYKSALSMNPGFTFSYYELIDVYQKTGEKDKLDEIKKKLNIK